VIRDYNDYIKKKIQFECKIQQRNALLDGIFELFDLDDMYFIKDDEINKNKKLEYINC
jgi:hypothetical protein